MSECRTCGSELTDDEKSFGWSDTCFQCVKESMTPDEYYEEFEDE